MCHKGLILLGVLMFASLYSQEEEVIVTKGGYGGGIGITYGVYLPAMGDSVPISVRKVFGVKMETYPLMLNTGLAAYIYIQRAFRLGVASFSGLARVGKASDVDGGEWYHYTVDIALRYDLFCMAFTKQFRNMEVGAELSVGQGHASLRLMKLRVLPTWREICEHDTLAWGEGFASEMSASFPVIRLTFGIMIPVTEWFKLAINVGAIYAKVNAQTWYLHEAKYLVADSKGLDLSGLYFEVSPRLDNRPLW